MKLVRFVVAITFAVSLWPSPGAAQTKISVSVMHSGSDMVGPQLAFAVREAIRRSAAYELKVDSDALFSVRLVTIDPDRGTSRAGNWAVASVTFTMRNWLPLDKTDPQTWYPIYLSSSVVTAGTKAVDDSARGIVAQLDEAVEQFKRDSKSSSQ